MMRIRMRDKRCIKAFSENGAPSRKDLQRSVQKLDQDIKESNISYRVKIILGDVYAVSRSNRRYIILITRSR